MIQREIYIYKLLEYKDKQLIKIITGVRRSGKSTLFELYQQKLNVPKKQIQNINLEDHTFANLSNWKKLYDYINKRIIPNKQNYIFIDEVQNIKDYYPKFLLTKDIDHKSHNGIMQINVVDWLLEY